MPAVRPRTFAIPLAAALGISGAMLAASPAAAATFPASTEAELMAAINDANVTPGADTITITANITLTGSLPQITDELTIDGQGNTLDAAGFNALNASLTALTVNDLVINVPINGVVVSDGAFTASNLDIVNATIGIEIDESDVLLDDTVVTGSAVGNVTITNLALVPTTVEIRDSEFSSSVTEDGLRLILGGSGTLVMDNVVTDDNDDFGIDVTLSGTAAGTVTNSSALGNGNFGVMLAVVEDAHLEIDNVDGDSNVAGGRVIVRDTAELISTGSGPTSNTASGWFIESYGTGTTTTFSNVLATLNGAGMAFEPHDGATITVTNALIQGGGDGLAIATPFFPPALDGSVIATGVEIVGSENHGVRIPAGGSVDVTLIESSIHGVGTFDNGAGILADLTDATLTLDRSTIHDNESASFGGGAFVVGDETSALVVVNSTITGNVGGGLGGLVADLDGTVDVRNSTIVGNISEHGDDTVSLTGQVAASVRNTIIDGGDAALSSDNGDTLTVDYSLVRTFGPVAAAAVEAGNNLTGVDPLLDPLADNGGPTLTMLPRAGSPVLNAGDPAFAPPPAIDQRGEARVQGGRVDMGAVEIPSALAATGVEPGAAVPVGLALLLSGLVLIAIRRRVAH